MAGGCTARGCEETTMRGCKMGGSTDADVRVGSLRNGAVGSVGDRGSLPSGFTEDATIVERVSSWLPAAAVSSGGSGIRRSLLVALELIALCGLSKARAESEQRQLLERVSPGSERRAMYLFRWVYRVFR